MLVESRREWRVSLRWRVPETLLATADEVIE
jgi:hypothetical protein